MTEKAALLIRVSTGMQKDNYSPGTQRDMGIGYCERQGYTLDPRHIFDDVYTAKDSYDSRPGLEAVKVAVVRGEIDVVIALKVDHVFRDQFDAIAFLRFLKDYGCRIEFVLEKFENSAIGRMMYSLIAYAAEQRWEDIREATRRGLDARIGRVDGKDDPTKGKPLAGGKPPYGYRWADAEKSRYVIYEPEARIVRIIFEELARGGTARGLCERFHAEGIPTPAAEQARKLFEQGKRKSPDTIWRSRTISLIAHNRVYIGEAWTNKNRVVKEGSKKKGQRPRPEAEQKLLPAGTAPAIITDEALFYAAQEQLTRNRTVEVGRKNRNPQAHLLRNGYARCGGCGAALSAVNPTDGRQRQPFYTCTKTYEAGNRGRCTPFSITAAELDEAAWEKVRIILDPPDWGKDFLRSQADTGVIEAELASVTTLIDDYEGQLAS